MSVRIKSGHGLVGWVAETHNSILNGNPSVDSGFEKGATPFLSALAVPLETDSRIVGVLALYHRDAAIFTSRDLEVLNASRRDLATWLTTHAQSQSPSVVQRPSFMSAKVDRAIEMIGAD
jgi:GAF domain-containing protein